MLSPFSNGLNVCSISIGLLIRFGACFILGLLFSGSWRFGILPRWAGLRVSYGAFCMQHGHIDLDLGGIPIGHVAM